MNFDDPRDAPDSSDAARLERIRAALQRADYTVDGVERLLGSGAADALHRDLLAPAQFALDALDAAAEGPGTAGPGTADSGTAGSGTGSSGTAESGIAGNDSEQPDRQLAALIRVYLLAEPVEAGLIPAVDDQIAVGLLDPRDQDGLVAARVDIRPYAIAEGDVTLDLWVASDLGGLQVPEDQPLRRDHVVGIGPATANLAQLTPRGEVARALDLGVGMGVQTLHLLRHVEFVVATDISDRALSFARFNLLINAEPLGLDPANLEARVSLRKGDLLEPVAGERFDLVVSNPPFVITPRREGEGASDQYTYRDGGRPGDSLVEGLVRGLGDILAEDGVAVMLGNWEIHEQDANWHARLETWPSADTDLWVVQREQATPIEYADMWLKDAAENRELESWRVQFGRYLRDFESREVDAIGMGMLFLHRAPEGSMPVRRFETLEHQLEQPLGARIRDTFTADDWLRERSNSDLIDETFVVAGDVTEERWTIPGDADPSAMLLRQGGGFRRTFPETTELASFVSVSDGELTGRQILTAIAALLEVDQEALNASVLRDVRDLVSYGFLVPRWM